MSCSRWLGTNLTVIGGTDDHAGLASADWPEVELVAGHDLGDFYRRTMREIGVMIEPVPDVGGQPGERVLHEGLRADRAINVQRLRHRTHHPVHGDDVVEIGEVIAMQVRDKHRGEYRWHCTRGDQPHEYATSAIDEHRGTASTHQCGRSGTPASGIGLPVPSKVICMAPTYQLTLHVTRV